MAPWFSLAMPMTGTPICSSAITSSAALSCGRPPSTITRSGSCAPGVARHIGARPSLIGQRIRSLLVRGILSAPSASGST